MNSFSDFKIKTNLFIGDKITVESILNIEIEIHSFKIVDSKHPKPGFEKCLHLQVNKDSKHHVLFTSSSVLINQINKVPDEGLPFKTKIVKSGKSYQFV